MSKTVTFRLPNDMEEKFEEFVEEENLTKSEAIRQALDQYMTIRKFRRLREEVLPFAEAQGILTDDDVFEIVS